MKITHVCPFSPHRVIGGVAMVVLELSKRQVEAGHEVHIFTSDWDKTKRISIEYEIVDNIHIHYCHHYLKIGDFSTVWPSVYGKLLELKPDIIHAHVTGHLHTYLAMKTAKKLEAKFVVTTHCPWESKRSKPATIANWISYKMFPVLKYADAVIAITPWERKFLLAEGVKSENIYVIPNGMADTFFTKINPNDFKEKHNIPSDNKIALFFGRLNKTKNPQLFIKIAEAVLDKRKDTTFVICGPDEGELPAVTEKINNLPDNIKKNIRLLPPTRDRKEVIEMYQASDIYLLPSRREGLPLTLFEAYAAGLPVIGSAVNGVPYELKDKINGFILPSEDNENFIKRTNFLLDNKLLRSAISITNKKKAKEFNWNLINKRTMKIYQTGYIIGLFK